MMREHQTLRMAITLALTCVMCWGGVPVPALAEMAGETAGPVVADTIAETEELTSKGGSESTDADAVEEVKDADEDNGAAAVEDSASDEAIGAEIEPATEDSALVAQDEVPLEEQGVEIEEDVPVTAIKDSKVEDGSESSDEPVLAVQSVSVSNPRVKADSSMKAGQVTTWDCVWLGSYPQTEVTASDSVYASLEAASWDSKGDATVGGKRYRRISKSDATYSGYWSDDGYGSATYRYFRWEPVKWRVLEANGNSALVVADVALDDQCYNTSSTSVTWETSSMRSWLNGYGSDSNQSGTDYSSKSFVGTAFDSTERSAIRQQTIANTNNISYGTAAGRDTSDEVFLLSQVEVILQIGVKHGFASRFAVADEARRCQTSDFARAMGAYRVNYDGTDNCCWWLRSPGCYQNRAIYVDYNGDMYDNENRNVTASSTAVRPALNLDLTSSAVTYAGTVSSNGTIYEIGDAPSGGQSTLDIADARIYIDGKDARDGVSVRWTRGGTKPSVEVQMGSGSMKKTLQRGRD